MPTGSEFGRGMPKEGRDWFRKHGGDTEGHGEVAPPALAPFVGEDGHLDMVAAQKYLDKLYGTSSVEDLRVDLDQPPERITHVLELKPEDLEGPPVVMPKPNKKPTH